MPIATATATGKAALTTAAVMMNGVSTNTLPLTQSAANAINGTPLGVGWFVHTRTAVSRKPAMTAIVYPNSISWPCQTGPCKYAEGRWPENCAAQSSTLNALKRLASR